ncbi:hypothetical protein LAA29_90017 [Leuconostoc carnosum]|nr:hypothetical protein LAA29_90017 [Leuconostoc carnosum]
MVSDCCFISMIIFIKSELYEFIFKKFAFYSCLQVYIVDILRYNGYRKKKANNIWIIIQYLITKTYN